MQNWLWAKGRTPRNGLIREPMSLKDLNDGVNSHVLMWTSSQDDFSFYIILSAASGDPAAAGQFERCIIYVTPHVCKSLCSVFVTLNVP